MSPISPTSPLETGQNPGSFKAWSDERIAAYKRPRRYLFVDSIPMTFSLKPLRKDLRQLAIRTLGTDWSSPARERQNEFEAI